MVMSVCKAGDSKIIPRNVHKSAINAMILCGITPVYVDPGIHPELGISLGMDAADVEAAIKAHQKLKPSSSTTRHTTAYAPTSAAITEAAHAAGMAVLADEAHGHAFLFRRRHAAFPAMAAGADMSAVSMHKTGGSLTQSSLLLMRRGRVSPDYVRTIIGLTQTTSASYLLMSSLDIARRRSPQRGRETFRRVVSLAEYARAEINRIVG